SIFAGSMVVAGADERAVERRAATVQMINAYRVRGHFKANIDPLGRREKVEHPELTPGYYGLSEADLQEEVSTRPLFGMPPRAKLAEVLARCRVAYTDSIGAEFMNIDDLEQKKWVQERLETLPHRHVLDRPEQKRILRKLCDAENFERMLHTRFPGTKRFSLEGAETLIPLLDLVNEHAAAQGVREIVIGMAHRGRLNTLVNLLEKPASAVVSEFMGNETEFAGSGDVKYHKGYSANTVTVRGDGLHLSLTPNPSHLEAVNAIVEGRVRAKQDRTGDFERSTCMAVLIHGDAAFAGQGLVPEVLNLSELAGYRTGGTIHVIVNNQIGFTTPPREARSTPYATGVARMLGVPIFHVNGEEPRAVAAVVRMAVRWRQMFKRDVVIDMYCYRKHGHNEGDEPSYTQPLMYEQIRSRPTPREVYQKVLVEKGDLTAEEAETIFQASKAAMDAAAEQPTIEERTVTADREIVHKADDPDTAGYAHGDSEPVVAAHKTFVSPVKIRWENHLDGDIREHADTSVDPERLREILIKVNTLPPDLKAHVKVKRLIQQRIEMIQGERGMDWAMGEQAAFASLLADSHPVRLSGQDSGRGTFSHRHAVITDIRDGREYFPLNSIHPGRFGVFDSSLSEAAVLGFELGFSFDTPEGLVMWEAQFGDFANGAQVIIDQFLTSSEQKWERLSNLVLMLPHGYEGQGPEHSSARLERFLLMCAEDNMQVANVTTPSQYFHMLRAQVKRKVRKPLVVMTPKSLLRHPLATNTLEEIATGTFQPVIPEIDALGAVRRIVFCSGKVYYELLQERRERGIDDVALVRVEMLYPWPADVLAALVAEHPGAELVWAQEEPRNMGAWPLVAHWAEEAFGSRPLRYVGRPAAASPATGSSKKHKAEQAAVIEGSLT
ncbi:MAG: 2-oxoglutarate dehydrogenase E1 component, partial [Myxococcales bacterium]|nr:2-oxoglutarate dehydrogenase E1 component [Myxococcales bacterium]